MVKFHEGLAKQLNHFASRNSLLAKMRVCMENSLSLEMTHSSLMFQSTERTCICLKACELASALVVAEAEAEARGMLARRRVWCHSHCHSNMTAFRTCSSPEFCCCTLEICICATWSCFEAEIKGWSRRDMREDQSSSDFVYKPSFDFFIAACMRVLLGGKKHGGSIP